MDATNTAADRPLRRRRLFDGEPLDRWSGQRRPSIKIAAPAKPQRSKAEWLAMAAEAVAAGKLGMARYYRAKAEAVR